MSAFLFLFEGAHPPISWKSEKLCPSSQIGPVGFALPVLVRNRDLKAAHCDFDITAVAARRPFRFHLCQTGALHRYIGHTARLKRKRVLRDTT